MTIQQIELLNVLNELDIECTIVNLGIIINSADGKTDIVMDNTNRIMVISEEQSTEGDISMEELIKLLNS